MKLETFSVTNYRSITTAHKIELNKYTVLIGRNNEGKSNILHALNSTIQILFLHSKYGNNISVMMRKRYYDWIRDFPIQIQNRKRGLQSRFRIEFSLNEKEIEELYKKIGSKLNGSVSVEILMGRDNIPDIKIPKQGKNAKALTKKSREIANFICEKVSFNYIPAVRTENSVLKEINNIISEELEGIEKKEDYINAISIINELQQEVLNEIAEKVKKRLQVFMPKIKDIKLNIEERDRFHYLRRYVEFIVDDGNATNIEYKGDGIKSLAAIAMLKDKTIYKSTPIIAIEEPESHLHPSAINQLNDVIMGLSKDNQVIVTTHNPLFVVRNNNGCNIIVENGRAKPAKNIKEIRDVLGVRASDNLINTKYVLVVEGEDDKTSIIHILSLISNKIQRYIKSNLLGVEEIGGASNLSYKLTILKNSICVYHVLLDKDDAGNKSFEKARNNNLIDIKHVTFTNCNSMKESEFEDCLNPNAYNKEINNRLGVDLKKCKEFKNNKKKWSDRIKECFCAQGKPWNNNLEKEIKYIVTDSICKCKNIDDILIPQKSEFLYNLKDSIEELIDNKS